MARCRGTAGCRKYTVACCAIVDHLACDLGGRRTEQVKTGQVNPDRPLVGPSVNTFVGRFVGAFVGSPRRALKTGKSSLVGPVVGALERDLVDALMGPLVGPLVVPLVDPLVGRGSLSPALCLAH